MSLLIRSLVLLSLIAPEATINIIRDYEVAEKTRVERPVRVTRVLEGPNRACITNADEPVVTSFAVFEDGVRCEYCGRIIREAITDHLAI